MERFFGAQLPLFSLHFSEQFYYFIDKFLIFCLLLSV